MYPDFSLYRRVVVKALNSELTPPGHLQEDIGEEDRHLFSFFETALFNVAVKHYFQDDSSMESVLAFIDSMGEHYSSEDRLSAHKPFITEGMIRSALHDGLILFEIVPNNGIQALKFPVLWKIAQVSPDFLARIEYFMDLAQMQAQDCIDSADLPRTLAPRTLNLGRRKCNFWKRIHETSFD